MASVGGSPTGSERSCGKGVGFGGAMPGGGGGGGGGHASRFSPPYASAAGRLSPEARGGDAATAGGDVATAGSRYGEGPHTARRSQSAVGGSAADDLGDLSARRVAMMSRRDPDAVAPSSLVAGGYGQDARAGLDVRGDGTVGTGFAAASESLGWLRNDSHQGRLEALRKKYGYEQ